jgi:hypothetical protein
MDAARGSWFATLSPGAVLAANHPATLLAAAVAYGLDLVYGQSLRVSGGEVVGVTGAWPPAIGTVAPDASLASIALRAFRPDQDAAADGEPMAWNLWRRYVEAGVRIANVEEPLAICDADEPDAGIMTARGEVP